MRWLPLLLLLMFVSCRSVQYVPVETIQRDSIYITQHRIDSVLRVDSTSLKESAKGDTIFIEKTKWQFRYRYQSIIDTMYIERIDSVQVPYPVEKKLSKWQSFKQDIGGIAIGVAIALVILIAILIYRKRKTS